MYTSTRLAAPSQVTWQSKASDTARTGTRMRLFMAMGATSRVMSSLPSGESLVITFSPSIMAMLTSPRTL